MTSTGKDELELFPYKPRKYQREMVLAIRESLERKVPLILESGTGSGKTICVVSQALKFSIENDKRIIYITRTNAQQRQVIEEVREIAGRFPDFKEKIFSIGMQGRSHTCLLAREDPELSRGSAEELSRFCSEMKRRRKGDGCPYFEKMIDDTEKVDELTEWMRKTLPTVEEVVERCRRAIICPYELNRMMLGSARMVIAPYIYIFDEKLRSLLLEMMGTREEDTILIVDEAHNLPEYLREILSSYLSIYSVNQCIAECERFGNPFILRNVRLSDFLLTIRDAIDQIRGKFLSEDKSDALLEKDVLTSIISDALDISRNDMRSIAEQLIIYGEEIKDLKQREKKLPRSYIYRLGAFLTSWLDLDDESFVRLIVDETDGRNPRIEIYCLDPAIGARPISKFYTSIHMSGTLSPLDEYKDSLSLPEDTKLISFPSPFPKENRRVVYTPLVSTKYEEIRSSDEMVERIKEMIVKICNNFSKNTIVFFPSFDLMKEFVDRGLVKEVKKTIYLEKREMKQDELMDIVLKFKKGKGKGNVMLSVVGGRISEGMDFPAEELEIAIIVGIPYPKPTARQKALQRYYDKKFGKGWDYAVNAPTARKLLQSIGRLIRDEKDRGIAVILDRRAYRFRRYLSDLKISGDLIKSIKDFLEGG
ncbi:MAG TPA: ATP-dependent DNA helicase [Thermoplasmatales archaeon]|nr:ATP-dependent DNA helicase [Thermoplasmatales archaeon]HEX17679.1 ATP-dependent DNA helicase [Thermoplasmatales archaeon]